MGVFRFSAISTTATYALSSNVVSTVEGNQAQITLTTTGVQRGQAIPFTISGPGITTSDFVGLSSLTGNFTVQNGTATVTLTTSVDFDYETTETFTVFLTDHPNVSVEVDIINAVPGTMWDGGAAVWDAGASYWDAA